MPLDRNTIRSSIVDIVVVIALVLFFIYSGFKEIKRDLRDASFKEALLKNQVEQNKRIDIATQNQERHITKLNVVTEEIRELIAATMRVNQKLDATKESVEEIKKETVPSGRTGTPIP